MKFGPVPVAEARGTISAHSVRTGAFAIRKGRVLSAADIEALQDAGIREIVAVRLESGDVGEDEAALRLAEASAGAQVRVEQPFTGRSNVFARGNGLLLVDRERIDAINAVHESVTVATLPAFKPVVEGEMVATVKIIPYAVPRMLLDAAVAQARGPEGAAIAVAPFRLRRIGVISTVAPGLKPATILKTVKALQGRLVPAGASIVSEAATSHDTAELTEALWRQAEGEPEMIVVFGASAIADRRDVIPAAIEAAGGEIEHFGMPVDPGNLLLVGRIAGKPVIGAPGCARSPKENGFDWVLGRLLAGLPVRTRDIVGLGVGGLLMEIVSRGQPRAGGSPEDEE